MKKTIISLVTFATLSVMPQHIAATDDYIYIPTEANLQSREEFRDCGFGIFIHWGIYSMFGQNEWYLNRGVNAEEYAKAAGGFYPAAFNAAEWVDAFKKAGAGYVCFTTRHHDGFSMWHTAQSPYNIVDATPFRRDILRELSDECQRQDLRLHLYYSHLDWTRTDYPIGRTGRNTGRDSTLTDWPGYYNFMNAQLTELLTGYGPIGAIWFDGWWDHDEDATPFDWQLPEQYALIHRLQPSCLIGNNHHQTPFAGEDIQIFERDLPGENTAGLSGQDISALPLETCLTMNRSWGYNVTDLDYIDSNDLIRTLVRTAGKGANLLLNIGPQPDGQLPQAALARLSDIGVWMQRYGDTLRPTNAGFAEQPWGVATRRDNKLFIHILDNKADDIILPVNHKTISKAIVYATGEKVKFTPESKNTTRLHIGIGTIPTDEPDYIIELTTR